MLYWFDQSRRDLTRQNPRSDGKTVDTFARLDSLWQGIDAVQAGRVYLSPTAPFGWIGRPPSLNRMMGLHWMAGLRYPDRWQGDLRKDIVGCSEPANRVT